MQYVNFGQTGLKISRLGFGGIPIQRIDQPGTRELLLAAHTVSYTHLEFFHTQEEMAPLSVPPVTVVMLSQL